MRIAPIINNNVYNNKISFKSKVIDGRTFSDKVYADSLKYTALKYDHDMVCDAVLSRYSWFEKWFDAPFDYLREVHDCMYHMELAKEKNIKERERLRKQKEAEIAKIEEEKRKHSEKQAFILRLSDKFSKLESGFGLSECGLTKKQTEKLIKEVVLPFAMDKLDDNVAVDIPNGIIITGGRDKQKEETAYGLANQVLRGDFNRNFVEVSYFEDTDEFEETLEQIKENAREKYEIDKSRTIIYIQDFDSISKNIYDDDYDPHLNNFLKNYFLDCAENGCTILATASSFEDMEQTFLINKQRFNVQVDLDNSEGDYNED